MVAGHLQIKKGHYYMVLNVPNSQGKNKPKWLSTGIPVGGKKNEKKAEDMLLVTRCNWSDSKSLETVKDDAGMGKDQVTTDMLFADFMLYWLKIIKNSVEEVTYAGYAVNVERRIVPYFQKKKVTLGGLTGLHIESFYADCFEKYHVSGSTVQHYHANIHKALKYATRHKIIKVNPMNDVDRPQKDAFVGGYYTVSELEHLFEVVKGDPVEFPVLMAAFYGLRREEVMGLRWQSIDFESNTVTISHTVVQYRYEGEQKVQAKERTKNKTSCRSLPLVPQYRDLLLTLKERQKNNRELCGNCYTETDYIYVNDLGVPYRPNYVTQHFKLVLKKNHLREIRFHDLRHTCASLLLKNGVSMKDIQAWLGHSNFSTTANIYAHLETNSKNLSAETMNGTISINPGITASI